MQFGRHIGVAFLVKLGCGVNLLQPAKDQLSLSLNPFPFPANPGFNRRNCKELLISEGVSMIVCNMLILGGWRVHRVQCPARKPHLEF